MRIRISFMDAINGTTVSLPVTYDEPCSHCHGTGAESPSDITSCPHCGGKGTILTQQRTIFGVMQSEAPCPHCGGRGKVVRTKCRTCDGAGYKHVKKDISINIPAGINNGQQVRVKGKGERGINGGENGDLYIEVRIKKDPTFTRDGNDIHMELELSFVDCALGASLEVNTVYGSVEVSIPAGTQPNQILKLKGQGVKDLRTGRPGDQFLHVKVTTPTNLSSTEKDLLRQFQKEEQAKLGKWWNKGKK
jgi:molecular chaperone DnaJ